MVRLLLVLFVPTLSLAAPPGLFPNEMCWDPNRVKNVVEVRFNPALAMELENPNNTAPPFPSLGDSVARTSTVQRAIEAWNDALKKVGAKIKLKLTLVRAGFATGQGVEKCTDPTNQLPVFAIDYSRTSPDQKNFGSTGEDNRSRPKSGPGWIRGEKLETFSFERLAETMLIPAPKDPTARFIDEADIVWFTHYNEGRRCPPIRWNYHVDNKGVEVPPAPAPFNDYYSVMLHEIGHLLGLDHQDCPDKLQKIPNVMTERHTAGERHRILQCELDALKKLYGLAARCGGLKE